MGGVHDIPQLLIVEFACSRDTAVRRLGRQQPARRCSADLVTKELVKTCEGMNCCDPVSASFHVEMKRLESCNELL